MSTLKTNNLLTLDGTRTIPVSNIAEMNGGFSFRNKIVDGRFDFWYEGTSQTSSGYGSDTMWMNKGVGSTKTHSQQTLTAGVDLPAIECPTATYFSRTVVTSVAAVGNRVMKAQNIENVGSLAGKTVTLSFYAKADAVKNIAVELNQNFGSSGSTAVTVGSQLVSLSTAWKRYSVTISIPSISGKTVGTGSFLSLVFWFDAETTTYGTRSANLGQQSGTFDIACIQLEEGSVATPFEELPIEISKTRVNRYFYQFISSGYDCATAWTNTAGCTSQRFMHPVQMRTPPAWVLKSVSGNVNLRNGSNSYATFSITSVANLLADTQSFYLQLAFSGSGAAYSSYLGDFACTVNLDARL